MSRILNNNNNTGINLDNPLSDTLLLTIKFLLPLFHVISTKFEQDLETCSLHSFCLLNLFNFSLLPLISPLLETVTANYISFYDFPMTARGRKQRYKRKRIYPNIFLFFPFFFKI